MAFMMKTRRFMFSNYTETYIGGGERGSLLKWWKIVESKEWQQGIFYALCAAYALVSLVALAFDIIILDLPGLLFFSTYSLLVLFWAEIYHQARSLPIDKHRPAYFIINGLICSTQVCIWIYMRISRSSAASDFSLQVVIVRIDDVAANIYIILCCSRFGFMVYGLLRDQHLTLPRQSPYRLFIMLRRFPIESRGRQKKLHEVALSAFNEDIDFDVLDHSVLDLTYYTILPSASVLFILRKLPPRRVSDKYNPIK